MALVPVLLLLPILFFWSSLVNLYLALRHRQPALAKVRISQRGICLFLALVMLLSPEGLVQLAQADVQYSQLCTNSWGKGGQMGKGDIVNYSNLLFPKYIVCAISPAWTFPFTQPLSRLRDILKQPPFFARSAANASVQRGI